MNIQINSVYKKSQGLSLRVIIIAAVVLIVLIVLWSIFTGRIGAFSKELEECRGKWVSEDKCDAVAPGEHKKVETRTIEDNDWTSNKKLVCCLLEK